LFAELGKGEEEGHGRDERLEIRDFKHCHYL
jgi:hypothetical protein